MSLIAVWSPKGGSGVSTVAGTLALRLAASGRARLVDLAGDQPGVLGLPHDPELGLLAWLAASGLAGQPVRPLPWHPAVAGSLDLLPLGVVAADPAGAPGTECVDPGLAVLLAEALAGDEPTVVDCGRGASPFARQLLGAADSSFLVLRGCYLALRRAVNSPMVPASTGIVLVEEPGRALGVQEVADVTGRPVVARVPLDARIARAVDAGVLPARCPEPLAAMAEAVLAAAARTA